VNTLIKILSGEKILEKIDSPINGRLIVKKDIPWGTYIQSGGLTQSGGVMKAVWKTVFSRVLKLKGKVDKALIIGLGGGDAARNIIKLWPGVILTGVDIDPVIVNLGKKYMGLNDQEVKIVIKDGIEFLENDKNKYDLICVDTYHGDLFPQKFESLNFAKLINKHLNKEGIAIFNRLYYGEKRKLAEKHETVLLKAFGQVTRVYPEANLMFICRE